MEVAMARMQLLFGLWSGLLLALGVSPAGAASSERRTIVFQATDLFPESFDWDPAHDRFLLSSAAHGTISELVQGSLLREFVRDPLLAGKVSFGGLIVDARRNRVVVAVQDLVSWKYGGVVAYDLDTRRRVFFARLDDVGVAEDEKSCVNDLAVDFDTGNIYVTNCRGSFLWMVTEEGTPSVFVKHASFTSQPPLFAEAPWCSFNGVIFERETKLVLAVQTNSGALFRIRTRADADGRTVHVVSMKERLPGADGMVLRHDGSLVVVSQERVWLVRSSSNWMDADVVDTLPLNASTYATGAARKGRATFIVHAHLGDLFANRSREEFEVQELVFPSELVADADADADADDQPPVWQRRALALALVAVLVAGVVLLWPAAVGCVLEQHRRKRA